MRVPSRVTEERWNGRESVRTEAFQKLAVVSYRKPMELLRASGLNGLAARASLPFGYGLTALDKLSIKQSSGMCTVEGSLGTLGRRRAHVDARHGCVASLVERVDPDSGAAVQRWTYEGMQRVGGISIPRVAKFVAGPDPMKPEFSRIYTLVTADFRKPNAQAFGIAPSAGWIVADSRLSRQFVLITTPRDTTWEKVLVRTRALSRLQARKDAATALVVRRHRYVRWIRYAMEVLMAITAIACILVWKRYANLNAEAAKVRSR
jgi:hypothetical protein